MLKAIMLPYIIFTTKLFYYLGLSIPNFRPILSTEYKRMWGGTSKLNLVTDHHRTFLVMTCERTLVATQTKPPN